MLYNLLMTVAVIHGIVRMERVKCHKINEVLRKIMQVIQ